MMDEQQVRSILRWMIETWEGGYVNDPTDRGGETNFGISKRSYPDLNIKDLTCDDAIDIYIRDYWAPAGCDNYNMGMALIMVNYAVNMGVRPTVKAMQEIVTPDLVDGIIGPYTLTSIKKYTGNLEYDLTNKMIKRYQRIAKNNPSQQKYLKGWIRRARNIHYMAEMLKEYEVDYWKRI